jgi:hypothetical protein
MHSTTLQGEGTDDFSRKFYMEYVIKNLKQEIYVIVRK